MARLRPAVASRRPADAPRKRKPGGSSRRRARYCLRGFGYGDARARCADGCSGYGDAQHARGYADAGSADSHARARYDAGSGHCHARARHANGYADANSRDGHARRVNANSDAGCGYARANSNSHADARARYADAGSCYGCAHRINLTRR